MAIPDSGPVGEGKVSEAEGKVPDLTKAGSVSDMDLPIMDTPTNLNVNVSSSQIKSPFSQDHQHPHVPTAPSEEPPAPVLVWSQGKLPTAGSHPPRRFIKVQPFSQDDPGERKPLCSWLLEHWLLLTVVFVLLALCLALGIGLGVGLNCSGKFRCSKSSVCIGRSAQCDAVRDCADGDDELNCVRLSGRSSVLQVNSKGTWRTVCSAGWDSTLGYSACRQMGYSSYISSSSLPLSSVELAFQANLVSVNLSQSALQQAVKIHSTAFLSNTQCSSRSVIALKCIECGTRRMFSSRIVGGDVSKPGQFPWQASLHYRNQHLCGGSVITTSWIVTAAHCVYKISTDPTFWVVYVGLIDLPVNGVLSRSVEKIIYHAHYQPPALSFDIALMRLKDPLTFNGWVEPICLPSYEEVFEEGKVCWISGWGARVEGGETSVSMHSVQVPVLSNRECNGPEVYNDLISPWMVCAGYLDGGKDSCQGDSGGPLACEVSSVWKLAGVTSWGYGCAERNKPGVYTLIPYALTWIHQQMEKEEELNP
ncbi:transmembrane protease serine 3 [Esox lucius]|uniref:transmembrane protease serine 3 n=1 Tax=Esox lucius TaxID=8010 RepID=UPI0014769ACC|nr:transmembrane protease serine 3 [Esox lucius]